MKANNTYIATIVLVFCTITWCSGYSIAQENEAKPPKGYISQLTNGATPGWMPPSIEELTSGKVKVGDLITKDNVHLVKDYLTLGVYESVKKGMVLRMAQNVSPDKLIPKDYWDITMKNQGKAVMDENGTVRLADGSPWPGGHPFLKPKTPLEVMANVKFGNAFDDSHVPSNIVMYVGRDGTLGKTARMDITEVRSTGRIRIPPIGAVPGHEDTQWRLISVFTTPREMKGMGQLNIRPYDENKNPDEGFAYIPSFKRVIR